PERGPIERERLIVGVARAFDGDIRAAGKLRAVDVGDHGVREREKPNLRWNLRRPVPSSQPDRARGSAPLQAAPFSPGKLRARFFQFSHFPWRSPLSARKRS